MRWSLPPEKLPVLKLKGKAIFFSRKKRLMQHGFRFTLFPPHSILFFSCCQGLWLEVLLHLLHLVSGGSPLLTLWPCFSTCLDRSCCCKHHHNHLHLEHCHELFTFLSKANVTESRSAEGAGDEGSTPREGRLCDHCAYHHADHGNDGNLNQINGSLIVSFNFFLQWPEDPAPIDIWWSWKNPRQGGLNAIFS